MTRRLTRFAVLLAIVAFAAAACGGKAAGPILTDPTAIITAALKSSEAAKSVHVDADRGRRRAGDASRRIGVHPGRPDRHHRQRGCGPRQQGRPRSRSRSLVSSASPARSSRPDGKTYLKTTLTGPKYKVVDAGSALPVDPTNMTGLIDNLGDFLLKPGVDPVKGDDVSCGGGTCYTIVVDLDATELAALIGDGAAGLPVDIAGASLKMTLKVEQSLPNHLAGVSDRDRTAGRQDRQGGADVLQVGRTRHDHGTARRPGRRVAGLVS